MSGPAAFSRLQLAAALLEYDNDPDDPNAPYRSAQDSAIFAHFRRNPAARPGLTSNKPNYLGVSIPSDAGSRHSALETRRSRGSRGSMDALRNPFGADHISESEDDRDEQAIEVDLASWGLDAFIPKEKSKSAKSKGKQPMPPPIAATRSHRPSTNHDATVPLPRSGVVTSRPLSAAGNLEFTTQHTPVQAVDRRRSFGSPLDLVGMEPVNPPLRHRRVTSQAHSRPHSVVVPFPSSSVRSASPGVDQLYGDPRPRPHERALSMASMTSRLIYDDPIPEDTQPELISSSGVGPEIVTEDNPFAIEHPSHISRFDPKVLARTRTYSNISMGSRIILENDDSSVMTGTRNPYSQEPRYTTTMDLLRPKVLVMPSPLQAISPTIPEQPARIVRDGFEFSQDGPPLPPGARTSRRLSSTSIMETEIVPLASNPFIPNPHIDLSLSQKTFRNTLVVGGQSGTYIDVDGGLPRATEDGQQVMVEEVPQEDILPLPTPPEEEEGEEESKALRPAGKLYGRSLIDDLESRKAQMRNKQRVFTGDERPSMMARQRTSTLIDPASLQTRPMSKQLSSSGPQALGRQNSMSMKPLLNFNDEDKGLRPPPVAGRLPTSRSVFGVDTLWEREMAKLKEIEAQEAREKEETLKREQETERKNMEKKRKHKKKGRHQKNDEDAQQASANAQVVPVEPPILPDIRRATRNVPPKANADYSSDATSESEDYGGQHQPNAITPAWHDNSSDEDAGPQRTTGVGLRYPKSSQKIPISRDNDSEEDLPLAATIPKAAARAALGVSQAGQDSDDEDQPLSRIVIQAKAKLSPPRSTFYAENQPADDDDDQPLGLRTSRFVQNRPNADDEDDLPLAFHPEQQRRTQYQMLAQHQHQQQMMMQAQMQSNMLMSASMMGPGYFAPLVHPMGMIPVPMPVPSPPPMHDEVKFGRVDRWRRDIVVDE